IAFEGKPLIYDAADIIPSEVTPRREVLGREDARDVGISRQEELAIASRADEVWTMNEKVALAFSETCERITVVGSALTIVEENPKDRLRSVIEASLSSLLMAEGEIRA
ncbi:MAG: hypothetical protein K8R59_03010, partial [Thermoanaerobaculales bacterium]|nr:hypothetical protein [Thermoanaerobaculales bacterium]